MKQLKTKKKILEGPITILAAYYHSSNSDMQLTQPHLQHLVAYYEFQDNYSSDILTKLILGFQNLHKQL